MTSKESKTCPDCQQSKPLGEFYVDRRSPTGRTTYCKPCTKTRQKTYRQRSLRRGPRSHACQVAAGTTWEVRR